MEQIAEEQTNSTNVEPKRENRLSHRRRQQQAGKTTVHRDQFIDVCQEYEIFGIPSFIAFQNGKEVGRFVSKDRKTKEEIMNFMNHLPS